MNIRTIELTHFMTHDRTTLELPSRGVVAVTGENGAGKSGIVEGVSWAGWGKTLRGSPPWRGDAKDEPCASDIVTTDGFRIHRGRRGSKTELTWSLGEHAPTFETPSKAQEALATALGPFDLWRRSHVFSSADATHFTLATDKERKQLIESFLGNTAFDGAVERCRADLKAAEKAVAADEQAYSVAAARHGAAINRREDAASALRAASPPPPPPDAPAGKSLVDLDGMLANARRETAALRNRLRGLDSVGGELRFAARTAQALLDRLRADRCPTCTQAVDPALRAKVTKEMNTAKTAADKAQADANVGKSDVEAAIAELEEELTLLQKKRDTRAKELSVVEHARAEAARFERTKKQLESALASADGEVTDNAAAMAALEPKVHAARANIDELREIERVLGLKGVRAMILGQSLSGIEALANAWLARFKQGLQISLAAYAEQKNGSIDDSISLEVTGAGGGYGYKGASSGERRRLDVALLLALAEVASAARGQQAGTLWFDEVFDALDEQGTAFVVAALGELAQTRAVVVITHSKLLLEHLPIARRVHIVQGRASVV